MQERLKILELVAEGKLTPEQADLLLDALKDKNAPKSDPKAAWEKATSELKSLGTQMSSAFSQSVNELRRGLETNLTNIAFGDTLAVSLEHSFEETTKGLTIDAQHARVRVERWSEPRVRLYIQSDIRADDPHLAKDILDQALQTSEIDDQVNVRLMTRFDGTRIQNARIDLYVPDTLDTLTIKTHNGSIFVSQTQVHQLHLDSVNGQIHVWNTDVEALSVTNQNGNIQLRQLMTTWLKEIRAEAKNGSIELRGLPASKTVEGQAKTSMGVVEVNPEHFSVDYTGSRKNACTFHSKSNSVDDSVEQSPVISVYLETKNGKINVQ